MYKYYRHFVKEEGPAIGCNGGLGFGFFIAYNTAAIFFIIFFSITETWLLG